MNLLWTKWTSNYFQGESCLPRIMFVSDHLTEIQTKPSNQQNMNFSIRIFTKTTHYFMTKHLSHLCVPTVTVYWNKTKQCVYRVEVKHRMGPIWHMLVFPQFILCSPFGKKIRGKCHCICTNIMAGIALQIFPEPSFLQSQ